MPPRGFVLRPPLALSPSVCKGAYFDALCVLLRMRYSSYPLGSRHGALVLGGEREKRRRGRKRKKVLCGFFFFFLRVFFPRRRLLSITIIHQPKLFNGSRVSICRCFSVLSFSASIDRASIIAITRPGRIENRLRCPFSLLSLHPLSSQLSGRFSLNDALVLLPPTLSTLSSFSTP